MVKRIALPFFVAALSSALVWAISPVLTGRPEPWDASGPYYVSALGVAGAISGALLPRSLVAHYLGAAFGQAIYELCFLPVGPLFLLGLLFLLGYSLVFLAAAAVAIVLKRKLG